MIAGKIMFNGVNVIFALTGIVGIVLAFKLIPDKRSRNFLIVAFLFMILGGILMPACYFVSKFMPVAGLADMVGKTEGFSDKLAPIKYLYVFGFLFEAMAMALIAGVTKKMLALRTADGSGVAEQSGGEAQ
jgi:hypothetical protein